MLKEPRLKEEAERDVGMKRIMRSCTHLSVFNEVFDFSASAKDCAPVSPIRFCPRLKEDIEMGGGCG